MILRATSLSIYLFLALTSLSVDTFGDGPKAKATKGPDLDVDPDNDRLRRFPDDLWQYLTTHANLSAPLPPPYATFNSALERVKQVFDITGAKQFSPQKIATLLKFYADRNISIGGYQRSAIIKIEDIDVQPIDRILLLTGNTSRENLDRARWTFLSSGDTSASASGGLMRTRAASDQHSDWIEVLQMFEPDLQLLLLSRMSSSKVIPTFEVKQKLLEDFAKGLAQQANTDPDTATSAFLVYLNPPKPPKPGPKVKKKISTEVAEMTRLRLEYADALLRLSQNDRRIFFLTGLWPTGSEPEGTDASASVADLLKKDSTSILLPQQALDILLRRPATFLSSLSSKPDEVAETFARNSDDKILELAARPGVAETINAVLENQTIRRIMGNGRVDSLCRSILERTAHKP